MTHASAASLVLIVDDEEDLCRLLTFALEPEDVEVRSVGTGQAALQLALEERPAVVVLDLMLPDIAGTEVCRRLRSNPATARVGVLMLTARGNEADRLLGFEVGADDYVVKPFSTREVVMRVRALARRIVEHEVATTAGACHGRKRMSWRGLEIDPQHHRAYRDGVEFSTRPLEYKLLSVLLEHPGRVFSRAELLAEVWGGVASTNTRTVDVHVRRLRATLGKYEQAIETIHGVGYRLREP